MQQHVTRAWAPKHVMRVGNIFWGKNEGCLFVVYQEIWGKVRNVTKINIALHSFCIHYISNPWQPFRQNKAWISPCHSLVPLNGRARCLARCRFPLAWWRDPFPSLSFGGRLSNCGDNLSPLQCILRRDAAGGCGFLGQGLLHRAHASKGLMAGLEGQPGFEGTSRMGRTLVSGLSTHPHFCQIHTGLVLESDKLLQKHTGILWQGNVKNQAENSDKKHTV